MAGSGSNAVTTGAVPEPASAALVLLGGTLLAARRRRSLPAGAQRDA
jgi:hypothetical protein